MNNTIKTYQYIRDVTNYVLKFRNFLVMCWPAFDDILMTHDWDDDMDFFDEWLRVNWELLVERQLQIENGAIQPYEFCCNTDIPHVLKPEQPITHFILCQALSDKSVLKDIKSDKFLSGEEKFIFSCLLSEDGFYPPFDHVSATDFQRRNIYKLKIDSLKFGLFKICDP